MGAINAIVPPPLLLGGKLKRSAQSMALSAPLPADAAKTIAVWPRGKAGDHGKPPDVVATLAARAAAPS